MEAQRSELTERSAGRPALLDYGSGPEPHPRLGTRKRVLVGCAFLIGFGLLLGQGLVRGVVGRVLYGDQTVKLWGYFVLTPVTIASVTAGLIGIRYWWLERKGRPLPDTDNRTILFLRTLFHESWEH